MSMNEKLKSEDINDERIILLSWLNILLGKQSVYARVK
jgi:hypothetical protein